jgi:hypothetical protein
MTVGEREEDLYGRRYFLSFFDSNEMKFNIAIGFRGKSLLGLGLVSEAGKFI